MKRFKRRYIVYFTLYTDSNVTIKNRRKVIKAILGTMKIQKEVIETDSNWKGVASHFLHALRYNLFRNILRPREVTKK